MCGVTGFYDIFCELASFFHFTKPNLLVQFPFNDSGSMDWIMIDFAMKVAEDEN